MTQPPPSRDPDEADTVPPGAPAVPGYRVRERLGRGGMATVWLALQESLERLVAIKVMSPEALADESQKQRFEQEARTIAKLEHPAIVGIHEVGRTGEGHPYYVMPYLANGSLDPQRYAGDERAVAAILRPLLSALEYAHARGVVHRDVKADNVLFDSGDRPLLTDFGIALASRDQARITTAGLALGSGGYMAPEQARGEQVDGRADLYSVGVLAFELLTGQLPYRSGEALALALMHAQDPIPRLPGELRHWQPFIDRALAKVPEQRYRSASQMLRGLERIKPRRKWAAAAAWRQRLGTALSAPGPRRVVPRAGAGLVLALLLGWAAWTLLDRLPVSPVAVDEDASLAIGPGAVAEDAPPVEPDLALLVAAGKAQLALGALFEPEQANAIDTWTRAWRLGADEPAVADGLAATLLALSERIAGSIRRREDELALQAFERAREFATTTGMSSDSGWRALRQAQRDALLSRLEAAAANFDLADGLRAGELAAQLDPGHPELEDAIAAAAALPRPGELLGGGAPMAMVAAGTADSPGLAAMTRPVTRNEYARFAAATSRPAANCHNRLSLLQVLARRDWSNPPFEQQADHPVVCVNHDDARAYAQWLSGQSGLRLRLPSAAEWRRMSAGVPAGQCSSARLNCGRERGTLGVGRFSANALGLRDLNGNVSEWLSDCGASGCGRRLSAGPSWRDPPGHPVSTTGEHPAERGFDDIGFRLVRELKPGDRVEISR